MRLSISVLLLCAGFATLGTVNAIQYSTKSIGTSVLVSKDGNFDGGGKNTMLPDNLSDKQHKILNAAYRIAKDDGHKDPTLIQGIILKETLAGGLKSYAVAGHELGLKANERYYGVGQIKVAAAKDVLKEFPELKREFDFHTNTDEEIIAKLIENIEFNLSVVSKYVLILKQRYGYKSDAAVAGAYNQGPQGAKSNIEAAQKYASGVTSHMKSLK